MKIIALLIQQTLITCGIMLVLTLTNSLLFLLTVNALGTLFVYIITCASLIKLRKKKNVAVAGFILPAGNLIALISIFCCMLIMTGSTQKEVLSIMFVIGAGCIVYIFLLLEKKLWYR